MVTVNQPERLVDELLKELEGSSADAIEVRSNSYLYRFNWPLPEEEKQRLIDLFMMSGDDIEQIGVYLVEEELVYLQPAGE